MYELAKEIALNLSLEPTFEDENLDELTYNILGCLLAPEWRDEVIDALEIDGTPGADALIEKVKSL